MICTPGTALKTDRQTRKGNHVSRKKELKIKIK